MGVFARTVGEWGGGTAMAGKHTANTENGEEKVRLSIETSSREYKKRIGVAAFINMPVLVSNNSSYSRKSQTQPAVTPSSQPWVLYIYMSHGH